MDRLRDLLDRARRGSYEPLEGDALYYESGDEDEEAEDDRSQFSWVEYGIFFLLGIAMLWAWNMFLAAGPYFQKRFHESEAILKVFQSAELSVSTVANLGSMLILTKLQAKASYPKRIMAALLINIVVFTLLAMSTRLFLHISAGLYFSFLLLMVFASSMATGLCQNGVFAYVASFGQEQYTQGIMTGQAVAGVLPCVVQIVSVLSVAPKPEGLEKDAVEESSSSAFVYFFTATIVSGIALVAVLYLFSIDPRMRRPHKTRMIESIESIREIESSNRRNVPLSLLFHKLFFLAAAVFITFGITMSYPVFTQKIESVHDPSNAPRILQPASFIPLAFLFWNSGDFIGRLLTSVPALRLTSRPRVIFFLSIARVVFIPMYMLCNVRGHTATIHSDAFYLLIVQVLFGMSNGYLGSSCMMGAAEWVDPEEREAAGGFMSLCLVAGLSTGSLLSFVIGRSL